MKRVVSLCLAGVLAFNFTSCKAKNQDTKQGSTLSVDLAYSYQSTPVTVIEGDPWEQFGTGLSNGSILDTFMDRLIFQFGNICYAYNYILDESVELHFPYLDQCTNDENYFVDYTLVPMPDGGFSVVYGTFATETLKVQSVYMEMYDADFNYLQGQELSEDFYPQDNIYHTYAVDANGNWFINSLGENGSPELLMYSASLEPIAVIEANDVNCISNIFTASDGQVYLDYHSPTKKRSIGKIDATQHTIINVPVDFELVNLCRRGYGDYIFTTYNDVGFYGVKADGSADRIVDWFTSDVRAENFVANDPILLSNGSIILTEGDSISLGTYATNVNKHWLLSPRSEEEIQNLTFITLSVLSEQADVISEYVRNYNRQSDSVHILLYNYDGLAADSSQTGLELMYQDMLEGTVADIICTNGLPQEQFQSKNIYKDLSELYNKEKNLSNKNYFTNFFDSMYKDDGLFEFSYSYAISTLAAKRKYVNDIESMDFSTFFSILDKKNTDPFPYPMYKRSDSFRVVFEHSISSWVDPETHQCNFESDDFIRLLDKFSKMYNDESFIGYGNEKEYMKFLEMMSNSYKEDRAIFDIIQFTDPYDWHSVSVIDFDQADISYTGWPLISERNENYFIPQVKFAINSESKFDSQAWDFFMYLLSDEVQERLSDSLPVNRQAMETRIKTAMQLPEDPMGIDAYPAYTIGDKKYPLTNATRQEMDDFLTFVEEIDSSLYENAVINNIVSEECEQFFNGDTTSAETAKRIQGRVSIYLSEVS